jgi:TonB family protein
MRLSFLAISLSAFTLTATDDWRSWLNRGIEAYKGARYQEAVDDFQQSVNLNPNEVTSHLYLGTAWMSQYIPGAVSPENLDLQHGAETEFNRALQLDPKNLMALQSLASLKYQEAQGVPDEDEKFRKFDEVASWYQKVLVVDPRAKEAYYSLAVMDWVKWYSALLHARIQLGMRPAQPCPLANAAVRQDLVARYSSLIADGIRNLERALEIDPQYDDAMAYMNLFLREGADLRDTPEQYRRDVELADQWVQKALSIKRSRFPAASQGATPLPRPPPHAGDQQTPRPIRVVSPIVNNTLIRRIQPVYPQEAKAAHIEGTVRFTATIGKDGRILNLQVISGHPLLAESALAAVRQWEYKPTLLNGQPVEIITTIDVNFTLSQ